MAIGKTKKYGMLKRHIAFVIPKPVKKDCITGDMTELITPLLAFTIPEAKAAFSFGMKGDTAPIIMPKHTAPVPPESKMPKVKIKTMPFLTTEEVKNPSTRSASPILSTKALDFFIARIPSRGWAIP